MSSDPVTRPPAASSVCPLPGVPLTWWRTRLPEALDPAAQKRLRAELRAAPALPLPGWEAAIQADATAAIGVAIPVLAAGLAYPGCLDRALSPVLLCAVLGDPACRDLLVHALGRRARRRADLDALRLAHRWCRRGHEGSSSIIVPGR
jgi:hypothetical protein